MTLVLQSRWKHLFSIQLFNEIFKFSKLISRNIHFYLNILNLIPNPKESHINDGIFSINSNTSIYYGSTIEGLLDVVNYVVKNIQISIYSTTASYNQINFVKSTITLGQ